MVIDCKFPDAGCDGSEMYTVDRMLLSLTMGERGVCVCVLVCVVTDTLRAREERVSGGWKCQWVRLFNLCVCVCVSVIVMCVLYL